MIFTNEQNFVNFPNMMVKCTNCDKVLYRDNKEHQLNDDKSIYKYLVRQCENHQLHYCCNCGHKLNLPTEVEYGKYTHGLGNGRKI